jgi:hypothetical protein
MRLHTSKIANDMLRYIPAERAARSDPTYPLEPHVRLICGQSIKEKVTTSSYTQIHSATLKTSKRRQEKNALLEKILRCSNHDDLSFNLVSGTDAEIAVGSA